MKISTGFNVTTICVLFLGLFFAGPACDDSGEDKSSGGSGLTVTKKTYNLSDVITGAEVTVYFNKSAYKRDTLMLRTLGVTQEWNIKSWKKSTGSGTDSRWLTADDTYSDWEIATQDSNFVNRLKYDPSDQDTITGRTFFIVDDTYQTKMLVYGNSGSDGLWDTNDDAATAASGAWSRTNTFDTSNRYEKRRSYTGDQETFQSSQVFVYNFDETINAIRRFSDTGEITLLDGFTFDHYSDRTVAKMINSSATVTGAVTFVDIGSSQIKVFRSSSSGIDGTWGTDDDNLYTLGNVKIYTINNDLITREDIYDYSGTTQTGYIIYTNR